MKLTLVLLGIFVSFCSFSLGEEVVVESLGRNSTEKGSSSSFQNAIENPYIVLGASSITLIAAFIGYRFLFGESKKAPPSISGAIPWVGCAFKYGVNPPKLLKEGFDKFGDIFNLKLFGETMTVLGSAEAVKFFFTAKEEVFSAAEAYAFTVPVFGKGVVYDADPEVLVEQKRLIKDSLTTSRFMKYVELIVEETEQYFEREWGDSGEKNILDAFNQVTVWTSTRCLQGQEVRDTFDLEFAKLYNDLDAALSPIGFFFPNAPLPSMRRRDQARKKLGELFDTIIKERNKHPEVERYDLLETLMSSTYKDGSPVPQEEIVGMLVALLLAGQHTSNVTGTWLGLFLLAHPEEMKKVMKEQEELMSGKEKLGYEELKSMQVLERAMKETLRLRPPIIMMMRRVLEDIEYNGYTISKGNFVTVAPVLTHKLPELWPNPEQFNPDRHLEPPADRYAFIAFGSGRHKCSGEIFAYLQIKTIWSTLLRKYDFEMVGKFPEPDYTTLIAGPIPPCLVRYKKKSVK